MPKLSHQQLRTLWERTEPGYHLAMAARADRRDPSSRGRRVQQILDLMTDDERKAAREVLSGQGNGGL